MFARTLNPVMVAPQALKRIRVVPLSAAPSPLDYSVPPEMALAPGDLVRCPLGPRTIVGVVWDDTLAAAPVPDARLRPVAARIDAPPIPDATRRLAQWAAGYYLAPLPAVLRMALPGADLLEASTRRVWRRVPPPGPLTPRRQAAWDAIGDASGSMAELARQAGCGPALIKSLAEAGALTEAQTARDAPYPLPDPDRVVHLLSPEQEAVAHALRDGVRTQARTPPVLLDGVTGSGKTEVYFEAVAEALRQDRQALVLLPEIALTLPWLARFAARFGCPPVVWHSGLGQAERRRAWHAIADGTARVVVGARSALFLPYPRLGLIVVDEEHEASFKQEDGICYQARDMAVVRGTLEPCAVVLASATPSLESHVNAEAGRYRRLALPSRHGGAALPAVGVVDLRRTPPERGRWLSPPLTQALDDTLARGEQALLFLNRRGYAPLTLCRACGERLGCPQCAAWLVEHKLTGRLHCHHCGYNAPSPRFCPSCDAEDTLVACGPGVERIAEEAAQRYPGARLALIASDTITSPEKAAQMVEAVEAGAVDILIGTQLVAKGYHFPNLTLVGVVDADLGLAGGDLRAAERTFQQITQVSGRAGRADKPGRVLLQSWQPDAAVLRALAAGDTAAFYAAESAARQRHAMPPFGRLAALVVSGPDQVQAQGVAQALARAAPHAPGLAVLGPAPAPLALLRGRHRFRLLLKADRTVNVQLHLRDWLARVRWPSSVRVSVDVDPYSFL